MNDGLIIITNLRWKQYYNITLGGSAAGACDRGLRDLVHIGVAFLI
jgi:hypothetical protein